MSLGSFPSRPGWPRWRRPHCGRGRAATRDLKAVGRKNGFALIFVKSRHGGSISNILTQRATLILRNSNVEIRNDEFAIANGFWGFAIIQAILNRRKPASEATARQAEVTEEFKTKERLSPNCRLPQWRSPNHNALTGARSEFLQEETEATEGFKTKERLSPNCRLRQSPAAAGPRIH